MLERFSIRVTGVWDVREVQYQSDWSLGCYLDENLKLRNNEF